MTAIASGCRIWDPAPKPAPTATFPPPWPSRSSDRPKPSAPGLNHRLFRRKTREAKFLVGVQQQDAVFGHDAHHHDQPHERRDVKRHAGDEEPEKHARRGQERPTRESRWGPRTGGIQKAGPEKPAPGPAVERSPDRETISVVPYRCRRIERESRRKLQVGYGLLYRRDPGSEVDPFEARRHRDFAL